MTDPLLLQASVELAGLASVDGWYRLELSSIRLGCCVRADLNATRETVWVTAGSDGQDLKVKVASSLEDPGVVWQGAPHPYLRRLARAAEVLTSAGQSSVVVERNLVGNSSYRVQLGEQHELRGELLVHVR